MERHLFITAEERLQSCCATNVRHIPVSPCSPRLKYLLANVIRARDAIALEVSFQLEENALRHALQRVSEPHEHFPGLLIPEVILESSQNVSHARHERRVADVFSMLGQSVYQDL